MKARVNRAQVPEQVLLYAPEKMAGEGEPVRTALTELAIPYRVVEPGELSQKIGYLTGLAGFPEEPAYEGEPFNEPVMVMQGLSSVRMDRLLLKLRRADARIDLKAAVTPTNQHWSLIDLCGEIAKEHAYMNQKHKTMHPEK